MKTFTRICSLLTVALAVCWGPLQAQETCQTAVPVDCGAFISGTTAGVANDNATSGAVDCGAAFGVGTGGQMWYTYTPTQNQTVTASTCAAATTFDSKIHVYTGSCGNFSCVTGDDDACADPGLASIVEFEASCGQTYYIRVGGFGANSGPYEFSLTCLPLDIFGCTDPTACNFNECAISDPTTCCFGNCRTLTVGGGAFQGEVSWQLLDASGATIATGGAPYSEVLCLEEGCGYEMVMSDNFGDGWNGNVFTITDDAGNVDATGTLLDGGGPESVIFAIGGFVLGCDDPSASNFDPAAECNDGSCIYCAPGTTLFTMNLFDSAGNGWNGATWTIVDAVNGSLVGTGTLNGGAEGEYSECMAQGCYTVITTAAGSATQSAQVSWELTSTSGAVIASGGADMNIGFAWAGATCDIPGCQQPECFNYNPNANVEDNASCVCPPANDDCANAEPIGCGITVSGTTVNASLDPSAVSCDAGIPITSPGVWYTFIGTGDLVNLNTCSSTGIDSKIHVFTGNCATPVCVTQNDDGCGGVGVFTSSISFTAINGLAYYVLVSEFGTFGDGIDFDLTMECVDCPSTPVNDACATALPLPTGVDFPGNLCCANPDDDMGAWTAFGTEYGIWYVINSADFSALDISFFNGTGQGADAADGTNVGIGLFDGAGCDALNPLVGGIGFDTDPADGSDLDGFIFNSLEFGLPLAANTNYYICVSTSDPINCGDFVLNVALANAGCTDPIACNFCADCTLDDGSCEYVSCGAVTPNDLCSTATPLVCGVDVAGSTGAATNTGAPTVCPVGANDIGVWYSFTGDGQFVNLSTCGSVIDSRITVVSSANGCAGPYTCVVAEDDDASDAGCGFFNGDDAAVGFVSQVGVQYYVYITAGAVDTDGDFADDLFEGSFNLSFTCEPVVEGCLDECACNYNAAANVDNGGCDFFSCAGCAANEGGYMMDMEDTFGDGWNGATYTVADLDGNVVAEGDLDGAQCGDGTDIGFDVFCLADGCYTMTVTGGGFPGELVWSLLDEQGAEVIGGTGAAGVGTFGFTIGAGVCGCTDNTACNYDAAATSDDGSCEFTSCAGCTDPTACNFDNTATINDATQCCFDNCVTLIMNDTFGDGWNGANANIIDGSGNQVATATLPPATSNGSATFCLADGCYTIVVGGGTFDNEITWTLTGVTGGVINGAANDPAGLDFSIGGVVCIEGCTIPVACNYDPAATSGDCTLCDFSSCTGCTYEEAANFDPTASVDDGSCDFSGAISDCPADLDGNGSVGVSDLLIFIAAYGTVCPN
jgi:hypothetical protein